MGVYRYEREGRRDEEGGGRGGERTRFKVCKLCMRGVPEAVPGEVVDSLPDHAEPTTHHRPACQEGRKGGERREGMHSGCCGLHHTIIHVLCT